MENFQQTTIVLLHAAYPYTRELGYLVSVYPQVYADFSLAIPLLSTQGMTKVIAELLEFAPCSKIMYASDATVGAEMYYLAAKWARKALSKVLMEGDLDRSEAIEMAESILYKTAAQLYKIKLPMSVAKPLAIETVINPDVKLIRLVWSATDGIRRAKCVAAGSFTHKIQTHGIALVEGVLVSPLHQMTSTQLITVGTSRSHGRHCIAQRLDMCQRRVACTGHENFSSASSCKITRDGSSEY